MSSPDQLPQPRKKFELVPDWKRAWRWLSVQSMSLALTIQITWASIDSDMRATIPRIVVGGLTVGLLVLGIIGRLLKQKDPPVPLQPPSE